MRKFNPYIFGALLTLVLGAPASAQTVGNDAAIEACKTAPDSSKLQRCATAADILSTSAATATSDEPRLTAMLLEHIAWSEISSLYTRQDNLRMACRAVETQNIRLNAIEQEYRVNWTNKGQSNAQLTDIFTTMRETQDKSIKLCREEAALGVLPSLSLYEVKNAGTTPPPVVSKPVTPAPASGNYAVDAMALLDACPKMPGTASEGEKCFAAERGLDRILSNSMDDKTRGIIDAARVIAVSRVATHFILTERQQLGCQHSNRWKVDHDKNIAFLRRTGEGAFANDMVDTNANFGAIRDKCVEMGVTTVAAPLSQ